MSRGASARKLRADRFGPKVEDAPKLTAHQQRMCKKAKRRSITNAIRNHSPTVALGKCVLMPPNGVGADQLLIDKAIGGSHALMSVRQRIGMPYRLIR